MNKQIIIFDDTERFQTQHRQRLLEAVPNLKERFEVPEVSVESFRQDLLVLIERWKGNGDYDGNHETCFDRAAILFVDYRLVGLNLGFVTGEEVAYFARSYSNCGLIVGLNQFGDNIFDLSLCGHPDSFADLNIGANDIENPGLWDNGWQDFRPWHWPLLPRAYEAFERRISELENLGQPLFEFLGLGLKKVQSLPRATLEHVTNRKSDAAPETTFDEFVDSTFCLRQKDITTAPYRKRVAAARLAKWLERFVLGGQNTLVDAPHLVARYPSLLNGEAEVTILNKTTALGEVSELPLILGPLEKYLFPKENWVSRPAWFWEDLKDEPGIDEVGDPWSKKDLAFRFCEDASAFYPTNDCTEFVTNLATPYTRRFVRRFTNVDYVPELRFSM